MNKHCPRSYCLMSFLFDTSLNSSIFGGGRKGHVVVKENHFCLDGWIDSLLKVYQDY